jgi:hypothetical protein
MWKSSRPLPDIEKLEFPPRSRFRRPLAVSMEISLGAQRSDRSFCVRHSLRPCCGNYLSRPHYARGSGVFATPQFPTFQQYLPSPDGRRRADIADRDDGRRGALPSATRPWAFDRVIAAESIRGFSRPSDPREIPAASLAEIGASGRRHARKFPATTNPVEAGRVLH